MPEAAAHAMAETATADVGETYTMMYAATHAMAEAVAVDVGETCTMIDAATHAMAEAVAADVGETCTMIDAATHAMAEAVAEFAVPAIVSAVSVIIGLISVARQGAAVGRIVYETRRTVVFVGIALCGSRLRSSKCSQGQPNAANQQDHLIAPEL
jgi:hypothetical protein